MNPHRFDAIVRTCADSATRRTLVRRLGALVGGGALLLSSPGMVAANHREGHCTKLGKKCHKHKDCCGGLCGEEGVCLTCAGVVAWSVAALAHLDAFAGLATSVIADIAIMADPEHGFDGEIVGEIREAAGAIGGIYNALVTEAVPAAAENPLRTLLEAIAASLDALSRYLEQVYEENFIETGDEVTAALETTLIEMPTLQAEIATLRDECGDS